MKERPILNSTQKLTRILSAPPLELSEFLSPLGPNASVASVVSVVSAASLAQNCLVLGFTGPNGAGKSSLIARLSELLIQQKQRVAVIAFDPSSPVSGGALLGDRIRLASDLNKQQQEQFLFRSIACQREGSGVHPRTWLLIESLRQDNFDFIFVESVGVGQTVFDLTYWCDLTCCLAPPESGDEIQLMKAGLLEMADLFLVPKGDLAASTRTENLLLQMLQKDHLLDIQNAGLPDGAKTNLLRKALPQRVLRVSSQTGFNLPELIALLTYLKNQKNDLSQNAEGQQNLELRRKNALKRCLQFVLLDETERRLSQYLEQQTVTNFLQTQHSPAEYHMQMQSWMRALWKQ